MPRFRCVNCGKHSNKFYSKCPDCGYTRMEGKGIKVDSVEVKNTRELQEQKKLSKNKFRGGRNESFIGGAGKQQTPRQRITK